MLKKYLLFLFLGLVLMACHTNSDKNFIPQETTYPAASITELNAEFRTRIDASSPVVLTVTGTIQTENPTDSTTMKIPVFFFSKDSTVSLENYDFFLEGAIANNNGTYESDLYLYHKATGENPHNIEAGEYFMLAYANTKLGITDSTQQKYAHLKKPSNLVRVTIP